MDIIAKASVTVKAPLEKVWEAFTNPDIIKQYMFGATVLSNWKEGDEIKWKGEWKGKPYEDKGAIQKIIPKELLQYSHFSPLTGQQDIPENYHIVTVSFSEKDQGIEVSLTQNKNATNEEKEHSEKNWKMMLEGMKGVVEK